MARRTSGLLLGIIMASALWMAGNGQASATATASASFWLPMKAPANVVVEQGIGQNDHTVPYYGEDALDFAVIGDPNFAVTAAHAGSILAFSDASIDHQDVCDPPQCSCWAEANYILVKNDGDERPDASGRLQPTASLYMHLAHGSVKALGLRAGDHVGIGQPLGTVGVTGCTTGPHLHFQAEFVPHASQVAGWWKLSRNVPVDFANPEVGQLPSSWESYTCGCVRINLRADPPTPTFTPVPVVLPPAPSPSGSSGSCTTTSAAMAAACAGVVLLTRRPRRRRGTRSRSTSEAG